MGGLEQERGTMQNRTKRVPVKVDLETYRRLKALATATERSVPKMIRLLAMRAKAEDLGMAQGMREPEPTPAAEAQP